MCESGTGPRYLRTSAELLWWMLISEIWEGVEIWSQMCPKLPLCPNGSLSALSFPPQAHSCVLAVTLTGRSLQGHVCAVLQQRGEELSPRSSLRFRPPAPADEDVDPKREKHALFLGPLSIQLPCKHAVLSITMCCRIMRHCSTKWSLI